jgi:antitoxin VapB
MHSLASLHLGVGTEETPRTRDAEAEGLTLSRRPENWDGVFAARNAADVPPNVLDRDERNQGFQDRDPFKSWVE